jgi:hypothetical protein
MRKAAGVIMIIIGAIVLGMSIGSFWWVAWSINLFAVFMLAWAIFAFIGGILCLMRRHWGVCLASAIAAVVFGLVGSPLGFFIAPLGGIVGFPLVLVVGIVSIVFISLRKKEWQEISGSVDGKVSYDG